MKKSCLPYIFLILLLCTCDIKYKFWKDKRIINDKANIENEWKFVLTIYYNNPNVYFDMPLELGQIRDGEYEYTVDYVFYERSFFQFFSDVFDVRPVEIRNKDERETCLYNLHTICDIKDRNGNILFWYSYDDENEQNPYMLLNGYLIKKNPKLLAFTKSLLESNIIIP